MTPRFSPDDEVLVVDGDYKGHWGRVLSYEAIFDRYFVVLPDLHPTGHFAVTPEEIQPLPSEEESDQDDEDEEYEDMEVPAFGMTEQDFVVHLNMLMERTMNKLGTVSAHDAFFGFQEFEGMTPDQVLIELLDKIESGMAMFAQAHILIARIGVALREVTKEAT